MVFAGQPVWEVLWIPLPSTAPGRERSPTDIVPDCAIQQSQWIVGTDSFANSQLRFSDKSYRVYDSSPMDNPVTRAIGISIHGREGTNLSVGRSLGESRVSGSVTNMSINQFIQAGVCKPNCSEN